MWTNLHALPPDRSMYTVYLTSDPLGTPGDDLDHEEVDVVAPRAATVAEVLTLVPWDDYMPGLRAVAVVDQSAGYVLAQDLNGDLR